MWLFPEDHLVVKPEFENSFFSGTNVSTLCRKVIVISGQSLVHLNSEKNTLKMK